MAETNPNNTKSSQLSESLCDQISFIGDTLGPFFLEDPVKGSAQDLFSAVADLDVPAAAAEWPFVDNELAEELLGLMKSGLEAGIQDEALMWEYRRLFIGPNPMPAPPWGTVYTDRDCVIFGEAMLDLRQWMREQGIDSHAKKGEPDDHIGLLLLLMAWIARHRSDVLVDYLRLHLLPWSSHFLDELSGACEHPFYEGLSRLTKESLEGIQSALAIEVVYPHFYR